MMNGNPEKAYPWVKLAYESKYMAVLPLYNECIAVLTPEQLKTGDEEAARIKAGYPKINQ
jgi:hypothetical protein